MGGHQEVTPGSVPPSRQTHLGSSTGLELSGASGAGAWFSASRAVSS